MRRIDDLTAHDRQALPSPDWLDEDFCQWAHGYFLERRMLPDEEDYHNLINAILSAVFWSPQGDMFLERTVHSLYPFYD